MASYTVKYKVGSSTSSRVLQLIGGTESEAISKLRQQNSVQKDSEVIILSIEKN